MKEEQAIPRVISVLAIFLLMLHQKKQLTDGTYMNYQR